MAQDCVKMAASHVQGRRERGDAFSRPQGGTKGETRRKPLTGEGRCTEILEQAADLTEQHR